jgi:predicted dehydrogenase
MNVGVIGAGNIARSAHLPALESIPSVNVIAIADVDERRAKKLARRFHIPQCYSNFEELIDQDSIQIIHVCTPPQIRLQIIERAAAKGKHLFVEKPLALTLDEALKIRRVVREHGVTLTVVQNYRCFPSAQHTKRRISGGYLGNIVSMQGTGLIPHPANQTKATHYYHPGGVLFDFAPHLIDMLLWFNCSVVEKVFAFGGDFTERMGFINYAQILLSFSNKAVAVADVSWMTGIEGQRFTINIHGTGGHILLDVRNDSLTEFHGVLSPIEEARKAVSKALNVSKGVLSGLYFTSPLTNYKKLILDFLNAIEVGGRPMVTVEQAIMTTAVLEAAQKSIGTGYPLSIRELFGQHTDEYEEIYQTLYRDQGATGEKSAHSGIP